MGRADNIEKDMEEQKAAAEAPKKLTLAAKKDKQESSKDRAARFFATHGMMDMGHLLGDEMSASAAKAAQQEAAASRNRMDAIKGNVVEVAGSTGSSMPSMPSMGMDSSIDDIPLDDDESEEKKRWKAVDALKLHRPPM